MKWIGRKILYTVHYKAQCALAREVFSVPFAWSPEAMTPPCHPLSLAQKPLCWLQKSSGKTTFRYSDGTSEPSHGTRWTSSETSHRQVGWATHTKSTRTCSCAKPWTQAYTVSYMIEIYIYILMYVVPPKTHVSSKFSCIYNVLSSHFGI